MVGTEVARILDKQLKLRQLRRTRERVRQLERELNGAPERSEEPRQIPEFLRLSVPLRVA